MKAYNIETPQVAVGKLTKFDTNNFIYIQDSVIQGNKNQQLPTSWPGSLYQSNTDKGFIISSEKHGAGVATYINPIGLWTYAVNTGFIYPIHATNTDFDNRVVVANLSDDHTEYSKIDLQVMSTINAADKSYGNTVHIKCDDKGPSISLGDNDEGKTNVKLCIDEDKETEGEIYIEGALDWNNEPIGVKAHINDRHFHLTYPQVLMLNAAQTDLYTNASYYISRPVEPNKSERK